MLAQYRTDLQNLLQNPAAPTALYSVASLDRYINIARGQLAGEGECIRFIASISTVAGTRAYNFTALNTGVSAVNGIQGAIHIRRINYVLASGQKWIAPRGWEWFDLYHLNDPNPTPGAPTVWSQYAQGSSMPAGAGSDASGSFYLDPIPDDAYTLYCDCVCYPITLVDDTTIEAIPYLWTDAVPFFAAYYAYLSSQTSARQADAERMYQHYQTFMGRARKSANPTVNGYMYQQAQDPPQIAKLGIKPGGGG